MEDKHTRIVQDSTQRNEITFLRSLQCCLCLHVLVQPVSLPCGHNYCKSCTQENNFQSYCHSCPLCRSPFYMPIENYKVNIVLDEAVRKLAPEEYYGKLLALQQRRIEVYMSKRLLLFHCWEVTVRKIKSLCTSVGKILPLLTFVFAFGLWMKYRQLDRKKYKLSMEDFKKLQSYINNLGITTNPATKLDEKDLQRLVYSRILKYMFSRFS